MDRLTHRIRDQHGELARASARRLAGTSPEVLLDAITSARPDLIDRTIAKVEIDDQREEDLNRELFTAAWMTSLGERDG